MSDPSQYRDEPYSSTDPDRFAAAIARLQGARLDGEYSPDNGAERVALPSRRARRPVTQGAESVREASASSAPRTATTPAAAMEVARLYSAAAGHPVDVEPESGEHRKPRFGLARTTALVAVCAVLTIGGGVVAGSLWSSSASGPIEPPTTSAVVGATDPTLTALPDEAPASAIESTSQAPVPEVYVHVVGQVASPGVVVLAAGSRVADAIGAAGGATSGADLAAINLARIVVDGEQLRVPAPGEEIASPEPPPVEASAPVVAAPDGPTSTSSSDGKINLNTADSTMLQTLPGIGPALSGRIIDWREANGPFASVDEITNVSGIGPAILSNIREKVVV